MPGQFNYLNMNPLGLNTNDCVIRGISFQSAELYSSDVSAVYRKITG